MLLLACGVLLVWHLRIIVTVPHVLVVGSLDAWQALGTGRERRSGKVRNKRNCDNQRVVSTMFIEGI